MVSSIGTDNGVRRYIECTVFVLVWMACGSLFRLGGNGYLLLGVPLVAIFQLLVVRRPLQQLWVREAELFKLDLRGIEIAAILVLLPTGGLHFGRPYGMMAWVIAVGAIPCAFAIQRQSIKKLWAALPSFGAAIIIGCAWFAIWASLSGRSPGFAPTKLPILFTDFLCFVLVGFVMEEVVFRGALDSYVAGSSGTRSSQWFSAIFVSLLWGLWHLPLKDLYASRELSYVTLVIFINILCGVPLSFCWRKGGTLILPSVVHAFCDAYRNVISM